MYTGPHLIKDNLVFGYDTGYGVADNNTTTRFYPGESTENLVGNSTFIGTSGTQTQGVSPANWIFSGETGSTGFQFYNSDTSPIPLKFPNEGAVITTGPGTSNRRIYFRREDLLGNTTYTLSCWMYFSRNFSSSWSKFQYDSSDTGLGGGYFDDFADYASANGYGLDEWFLWKGTLTTEATTAKCYWGPVISSGVNVLVGMQRMQVEVKGHVTPFVNGTRSSTQSLIDLTKTTDIDVSNVSFDSTGQPTFDGTDDGIDLGDDDRFDFTNGIMSVEAIVKFPNSWSGGSQYPNLISKGGSAGWDTAGWSLFGFRDWPNGADKSWGLAMRNGSTSRVTSRNNVAEDVFVHITATTDGTTVRLYENGIQVATNSQNINPESNTTSVKIGRGPSSQFFPGDIPIAKVYDKTLSPQEVKQNYRAYKNRFDL